MGNFIQNYWTIFAASLSFAAIAGFIADNVFYEEFIPSASLTFSVVGSVLTYFRTDSIKQHYSKLALDTLKEITKDRLKSSRHVINKRKADPIVELLVFLEYMVTEIEKCCNNTDQKGNFREVKGILASTKTTFSRCQFDKQLTPPYEDAVRCISELETYLNEI